MIKDIKRHKKSFSENEWIPLNPYSKLINDLINENIRLREQLNIEMTNSTKIINQLSDEIEEMCNLIDKFEELTEEKEIKVQQLGNEIYMLRQTIDRIKSTDF